MLTYEAAVAGVRQGVNFTETQIWAASSVKPPGSDQLMEVSYNALSGNLRIVPEDNSDPLSQGSKETNTSCFLFFDGVGLTEDGLKDWLRLCAKQVDTEHWHSCIDMLSHNISQIKKDNVLFLSFFVLRLQKQAKKTKKTKSTLSPQEIKSIHVSLHFLTCSEL